MADALSAIATLQPQDEASVAKVFELLGYEQVSTPGSEPVRPVAPREPTSAARATHSQTAEVSETAKQHKPIPATIEDLDEAAVSPPPAWLGETVLLTLESHFNPAYRKRIPGLFDPRRQRALVMHLASRLLPSAEIDLAKIAQARARLRPTEPPPYRLRRSVRAGVVAILDIGPAMQPFLCDIEAFAEEFGKVVGAGGADVRFVSGAPPSASFGGDGLPAVWRGLRGGTPVVIVSDFGARRAGRAAPPPRPDAWARFVAGLDGHVVGVAPCAPERISQEIRKRIEIIEWSREAGLHRPRR